MARINFDLKNRFSFYARACANEMLLAIALIFGALSVPLFADVAFESAARALKSHDLKTQYDALEKIKAFPTLEAAQVLTHHVLAQGDATFRLAELDQIATLQIHSVVPALAPLLNDKNTFVRQRAAHVIGIINGPSAEGVLLTALAHETDVSVKAALVQALGLVGSTQSVTALQTANQDADPSVRANASYARKRIMGKEAR
jgi:HEAT repeat protein